MGQLNLFEPERRPVGPAPSNPDFVRKVLGRALRLARQAERLPWAPWDTDHWATKFPVLAQSLPPEEGEALSAAFARELARLGWSAPT